MTVASENYRVSSNTDGSTANHNFDFQIEAAADLVVLFTNSAGVTSLLALTTDYTLSAGPWASGGTITLVTPANQPSGGRLTMYRVLDLIQELDLIAGGNLPSQNTEKQLDHLTLITQQLNDGITRSIRNPPEESGDLVLPNRDNRKNTTLAFDTNGDLITNDNPAVTGETVDIPILTSMFDAQPDNNIGSANLNGNIYTLIVNSPLNSGTPINAVSGIGKLIISIEAASVVGDITLTGTSVNRNTGVETPADSEVITVNAVSTDNSALDANGNLVYDLTGAYISSKWYKGTVTITTTALVATLVDVYGIAFEQFNDQENITINTLDVTCRPNNANADLDVYLYSVEVTGEKVDIIKIADVNLGTPTANKYYRLRQGNISKTLDGTTDGIFCNAFFNTPATNLEDLSIKIWSTVRYPVNLAP